MKKNKNITQDEYKNKAQSSSKIVKAFGDTLIWFGTSDKRVAGLEIDKLRGSVWVYDGSGSHMQIEECHSLSEAFKKVGEIMMKVEHERERHDRE